MPYLKEDQNFGNFAIKILFSPKFLIFQEFPIEFLHTKYKNNLKHDSEVQVITSYFKSAQTQSCKLESCSALTKASTLS